MGPSRPYRLGRLLGEGAYKRVYALEGQEEWCAAIIHDGDSSDLHEEVRNLNRLAEVGLPVVEHLGIQRVGRRVGLIMRSYPLHSRENLFPHHAPYFNETMLQSIKEMIKIARKARIWPSDDQVVVDACGRVFLTDPGYVRTRRKDEIPDYSPDDSSDLRDLARLARKIIRLRKRSKRFEEAVARVLVGNTCWETD